MFNDSWITASPSKPHYGMEYAIEPRLRWRVDQQSIKGWASYAEFVIFLPPTGKALAAACADRPTDIAKLALLTGRSPAAVKWLVKQDIIVPASLYSAALRIGGSMPRDRQHDRRK